MLAKLYKFEKGKRREKARTGRRRRSPSINSSPSRNRAHPTQTVRHASPAAIDPVPNCVHCSRTSRDAAARYAAAAASSSVSPLSIAEFQRAMRDAQSAAGNGAARWYADR